MVALIRLTDGERPAGDANGKTARSIPEPIHEHLPRSPHNDETFDPAEGKFLVH
jgi:hypothetical protein